MNPFQKLTEIPHPSLGIDLDGCVDESPIFFSILTNYWPGQVYVVTFRQDREKAIADLAKFNIKYNELVIASSFNAKSKIIIEKGILVYFDDQPEMLKDIPSTVNVMLVRNEGNFCFDNKLWMLSDATGKII